MYQEGGKSQLCGDLGTEALVPGTLRDFIPCTSSSGCSHLPGSWGLCCPPNNFCVKGEKEQNNGPYSLPVPQYDHPPHGRTTSGVLSSPSSFLPVPGGALQKRACECEPPLVSRLLVIRTDVFTHTQPLRAPFSHFDGGHLTPVPCSAKQNSLRVLLSSGGLATYYLIDHLISLSY